jgi:hypothetical protein
VTDPIAGATRLQRPVRRSSFPTFGTRWWRSFQADRVASARWIARRRHRADEYRVEGGHQLRRCRMRSSIADGGDARRERPVIPSPWRRLPGAQRLLSRAVLIPVEARADGRIWRWRACWRNRAASTSEVVSSRYFGTPAMRSIEDRPGFELIDLLAQTGRAGIVSGSRQSRTSRRKTVVRKENRQLFRPGQRLARASDI